MAKPLILVDGSSYLYRAFHALPSLMNSSGMPTGAIYGMVNMLRKLIADHDPLYMVVVFDAKGKTFRDELYAQYKAHRPPMPDELVQQIEPLHALILALGIPMLMIEGVEADDVIGTLAKEAKKEQYEVLISTGDKDFAQLVDAHVTLINTMTGSILNPETVLEKFGIGPHQIIDYLALVGDTVDNIPGVPNVGPKTAAKWLQEYQTLANIIANANAIKGKVGDHLRASLPHLPLSKTLATIKDDVPLNLHFNDLQRKPADIALLREWYLKLEFKTWLKELLEKEPVSAKETDVHYDLILNEQALASSFKKLMNAAELAFSIETTDHDYMKDEIVGMAFYTEEKLGFYIPMQHLSLEKLKILLAEPEIKKIGHHTKYVSEVLARYGITVSGTWYDTLLESYILDSASSNHNLETLALKYLGRHLINLDEIAGKGAKQIPFNEIPIKEASSYAFKKAQAIFELHEILSTKLSKEPGQKFIYETIEQPLVPVLVRMERQGVLIDSVILHKLTQELEQRVIELEQEVVKAVGTSFNLNSPKQLQDVLFNLLKLPVLQKTPTGQPSTNDAVLQELALEYLIPKQIIEFRACQKLISTYTKKLPLLVFQPTGRIHTSYHQEGTSTGRLSSSDPNLQNIPIRSETGRKIRQAFIAPPGYQLICADYSQIELRIMAHMSSDPQLLKAFALNQDIHIATASEVFGVPFEQVSYEERRRAKAINFGLLYGMSAFGLAKQMAVSRDAAQSYIDRYFLRYPGVKEYMETTRQNAKRLGYVETLFGRRLYVPDIHASQIPRQKAAERAAINAPLQGTAADIIKRAMISLDHFLITKSIPASMIMQVHDELIFEVREDVLAEMLEAIKAHMMNAAELKVPLLVSIGYGDNWDAAAEDAE